MIARAFALFIGLLAGINLLGDLAWPGFDANIWWIGTGGLPPWVVKPLLGTAAAAFLVFALRRPCDTAAYWLTVGSALLLAVFAAGNMVTFFWLSATNRIQAGFPLPLSLVVFVGLLLVVRAACPRRVAPVRVIRWRVIAGGLMLFGVFPVAQIICFGNTDYRRPADAVVVFGARAYADGRVSDALADRLRTACELYRSGLAKRMVLSGGPGDGVVHETEAMRRYAMEQGVRAEDIFMDAEGLNTAATVRNTVPLFREWQSTRVLAVSHFYHLPRIKLAYQRNGFEVCTVPARQSYILRQVPYSILREVAAFWVYYFRQPAIAELRPASQVAQLERFHLIRSAARPGCQLLKHHRGALRSLAARRR